MGQRFVQAIGVLVREAEPVTAPELFQVPQGIGSVLRRRHLRNQPFLLLQFGEHQFRPSDQIRILAAVPDSTETVQDTRHQEGKQEGYEEAH